MKKLIPLAILAALPALCLAGEPTTFTPEQTAFFEKDVLPLLETNCFKCHGGEKKIRGGFVFTSRKNLLRGGDKGPAVDFAKPEKSHLLEMLTFKDEDHSMPPDGQLEKAEIAILTKWVAMGAPYSNGFDKTIAVIEEKPHTDAKAADWWAYRKLARPEIPAVKNSAWVKNPIDAFILAGLEKKGLKPAAPADKVALIRRAQYDLTGLPPAPAEIDAFVSDTSPDAYEKLVDKLLASSQYGEKWGRHWLDLVRFAETNGYERDGAKPNAWRYRDYVIRSFNEDKPYDQFVKEQIAGDEMPNPTPDQIIATGYYRLGIWDDEPADRDQLTYDVLDGIVSTTSNVVLATTVGCARCHDHKKDPILQDDYYKMLAFIRNIKSMQSNGANIETVLKRDDAAWAAHDAKIAKLQAELEPFEKELREKMPAIAGKTAQKDIEDLHYKFYRSTWENLPNFDELKHEDEGALPGGFFDISVATRKTAFGFVFTGNLVVPQDGKYTFILDSDDGSRLSLNGKEVATRDGIHGLGDARKVDVELKKGRVPVRLDYFQNAHGLGLIVEWSGPGVPKRALTRASVEGESLVELAKRHGAEALGKEKFAEYQKKQKTLEAMKRNPPKDETALSVTEQNNVQDTYVLARGNPRAFGKKVEPGFPKVLGFPDPEMPKDPKAKTTGRRTILANWLVSPENPLTPRALANRVWQYHFGRGLCRTPNDFGRLGEHPTHPELLDWLASETLAKGWKLKAMHRLMMLSNAYRMSSADDKEALAKDPGNDSFWRFDMRRLGSEEIRDSILAVNGTLNPKMFGPSIYPEVPQEVLNTASQPDKAWGKSVPDEQRRRSVYIYVKRSLVEPIMSTFDVADTDSSCPVRFATTVPTQALTSLNSAFFNKQAAILAERLKKEAGANAEDQVKLAFRLATGRPASAEEVQKGVGLMKTLQEKHGLKAEQALNNFCLVVLNLNEFFYLD